MAFQLAHRLRADFPDGQLFVNLRGMDARNLDPGAVLSRFLYALGGAGTELPAT